MDESRFRYSAELCAELGNDRSGQRVGQTGHEIRADRTLSNRTLSNRTLSNRTLSDHARETSSNRLRETSLDLRALRGRYGLSQTSLAELIGVAQATVSRWECGAEEIATRRRHQLLELFSNRHGHFDPMIGAMVSNLPFVSVFGAHQEVVYIKGPTVGRAGVKTAEMIGRRSDEVIDMSWRRDLFHGVAEQDLFMTDCIHQIIGAGRFAKRLSTMSIRKRSYRLHFDGSAAMTVNIMTPLRGKHLTRLLSMTRWSEFL